jgi:hypothetical protein
MKTKKLKITVDQVSTMAWLHSFIKESTQNEVDSQDNYLIIDSESKFEMSVQTTEKVALALLRKKLNVVVEVVTSA